MLFRSDVERGECGSTEEHLTVTQFKVQAEQHRLETVTGQVEQAEQSLADAKAATEKQKKKLEALQKETKAAKTIALTVQDIEEMGKKNALTAGSLIFIVNRTKPLQFLSVFRIKSVKCILILWIGGQSLADILCKRTIPYQNISCHFIQSETSL